MKSVYRTLGYLLLLTLGVLSSCTKNLDVDPKSVITSTSFWKTPNDANGVVNGMYYSFRDMNKMTYQLGEGRSEIFTLGIGGSGGYDLFYNNTLTPDNMGIQGNYSSGVDWKGYYTIINTANLLLKYVPTISFPSDNDKNNILAQAYTMRAFTYFLLVKTWGDVPLRMRPTEGYAADSINIERTPAAKVFDQIKSDLDMAIQLFPDNSIPSGRYKWSKPSANALKADVYLWTAKRLNGGQADFTTALNACNDAMTGDANLLPSFSDIFSYANKGNKETLMVIHYQDLETTAVRNYFTDMYMFGGLMPTGVSQYTKDFIGINTGVGYSVWTPTALVRDQFTSDDTRRIASFYEIYNHTGNDSTLFTTAVLKGTGTISSGVRVYTSDIIIYRYAEVLLMKAEAENGLGLDPSNEMNLVRQRAYGNHYSSHIFVSGSQEDNDAAILKERLLELAFEGKRWWDLVRFDKAFEIVPSLQTRNDQKYLLLFPIPTATLNLEPKVTQNPGYGG